MDLKHLRTFVAVAESGTVSGAAERILIGQPALSRQIIELERQLGIALFDRVGRRLHLTGEGERFLEHCRRVLGEVGSLAERAQELRRADRGILRVAASPQMIDNVFANFLHRYGVRFPEVQVRLIESFGDATLMSVERGEVHLGVVVDEAVPSGLNHFEQRPLMANVHIAAHGAGYSLGRGAIEVRDLVRHPLLLLDPRHVQRKTFDAVCRVARVRPNILFEGSSPHSLLSLAEAGHGIAVVPSNVRLHRYDLKAKPLAHESEPLTQPLSIFWDRRRSLPRYAHAFCEMLEKHVRKTFARAGA
jgi:DNA-binding transcriptional LysR family regulator